MTPRELAAHGQPIQVSHGALFADAFGLPLNGALAGFDLVPADALLAVALADHDLKGVMILPGREAFVVRAATVADDGVANPEIKGPIENRRANEDGIREPFLIPTIGEHRQRERGHEDEEAKTVRKVFLLV